nr:hypothetical protein [Tanacetum cinerariifolium]
EEENMRIVEHELPKKMCDPSNFVLPVRVNGTIEMSALADTGSSVSVFPYSLFKNLGISDPKPYNFNLTKADNTQAKAIGEVRIEYLDDGDSLEARKFTVRKSKEELELLEALEHKSVDAELDMADSFNYMTEERFDKLGFVRVDYGKYERKKMKEVRVEIHGFTFLVDFVVIGYANEGEPSEEKKFNAMLEGLVKKVEEVGSSNGELIKIGKDSRNKSHNQKEKVKEALDRKYKELEESKPVLEVLENYMTYRKKLDEVMMGRVRLSSDESSEEENMRIVEHELPKKMCDPSNFVLPVRVNGTIEMSALADTGSS